MCGAHAGHFYQLCIRIIYAHNKDSTEGLGRLWFFGESDSMICIQELKNEFPSTNVKIHQQKKKVD